MTSTGIDPILSLASTLANTPTSHVLLIGADASRSAEIFSAWDVLKDIALEVAATFGPDDVEAANADVEAWYRARFTEPLRSESLLDQIASKWSHIVRATA